VKWYVIRHADKEPGDFYNPVLRHQDQPISAKGRVQAKKLSAYFTHKPVAKIYVSGYQRTAQTIAYVAQNMKLSPIQDSRLNEIDNGHIEGLSEQEIRRKYPHIWNAFRDRDRDFQFPGGESGGDALQRIRSFFEELGKQDEDIILVSHDGLIRLMLCYILGIPVYRRWDFQVDTCGITELVYQPDYERWKLIRFNHSLGT
jgi:broad specificity phosphatase PhoE